MEGEKGAVTVVWDSTVIPLVLVYPKLCPECLDSGKCQNRFDCALACWGCGGQMGLFSVIGETN